MNTLGVPASEQATVKKRAAAIFAQQNMQLSKQVDRMFALLMVLQWVAGIVIALLYTPLTWIGNGTSVHVHVWAAVFLGFLIISLPLVLIITRSGTAISAQMVAIGQMLTSSMLIHLMGGRIETHFHIFCSLALLAFYRDWRVLMTASIVMLADHVIRGSMWPQSIFGVESATQWRWVEHGAWVIFDDIILFTACHQMNVLMQAMAKREAALESANAMLGELKVRAESSSSAKSEFLANMSHEIRTPLTAILGYSDLMLKFRNSPSDLLNSVQIVRRNGQHLITLINDVLDLSKIEAGHMTVEIIPASLGKIVQEVTSVIRPRADEKKLDFVVELATPLPQMVETDPTRLKQILMNLLGNAVKFTNVGRIHFRLRLENGETTNPHLVFDVMDSGVGMTPDQLQRLFVPFTQADNTTSRKFGGTGLGLTISRRLARLLQGEIVVESVPHVGTRFTVNVPCGRVNMDALTTNLEQACGDSTQDCQQSVKLRGDVLLAEDGPDNQMLISFYLRELGLNVVVVENGVLAMKYALKAQEERQPFGLILMDMQMPEMDGYTATQKLRAAGYMHPIVALTAHALSKDREKCMKAGCDDYAVKPIDPAAFNMMLRQYLPAAMTDDEIVAESAPVKATPSLSRSMAKPIAAAPARQPSSRFEELCEKFRTGLPTRIGSIQQAWDGSDHTRLLYLVHQLKGAAAGFGFPSITQLSEAIESSMVRGEEEEAIGERIADLIAICSSAAESPAGPASARVPSLTTPVVRQN